MFGFLLLGYAAGAATFWTLVTRNTPVVEDQVEAKHEAEIIELFPLADEQRKAA